MIGTQLSGDNAETSTTGSQKLSRPLLLLPLFFLFHRTMPVACDRKNFFRGSPPMKQPRVAATALAALFTLAACAENPLAPVSDASRAAIAPSFARGSARSYTFTRFDVPSSFQTIPSGINADGVIVGWYSSGSGCPAAPC